MIKEIKKEVEMILMRVEKILRKMRRLWFAFNLFLFLSSTAIVLAEDPFGGGSSELPGASPFTLNELILKVGSWLTGEGRVIVIIGLTLFALIGIILLVAGKIMASHTYMTMGRNVLLIDVFAGLFLLVFLPLLFSGILKLRGLDKTWHQVPYEEFPNTTFTP